MIFAKAMLLAVSSLITAGIGLRIPKLKVSLAHSAHVLLDLLITPYTRLVYDVHRPPKH
jgi:hypothetical protein